MKEELKLCAHCENDARLSQLGPDFYVECMGCNISTAARRTAAEAVADWNARAPSPEVTALVEAARAVLSRFNPPQDDLTARYYRADLITALAPFEVKPEGRDNG